MEEHIEQIKEDTTSTQTVTLPFTVPKRGEHREMNYWSQLGLLLGLTGGGLVIGGFLSILIFCLMSGVSFFNIEKELLNPKYADANRVVQVVSTIVIFFTPAFLFAFIAHKKPFKYLQFNTKISFKQLLWVLVIATLALFVGSLLAEINAAIPISKKLYALFKKAEESYSEQIMAMVNMKNFTDYLIAIFIIALAPAIVEEVFFRGAVQNLLTNWFKNHWVAIIVTSIVFSAIHMSYFGFLTRTALGVVLGLLFYYGKSIWLNILAHFLNNAIAVSQLYYLSTKGKLTKDAMEDHFPIWLGVGALVLLIGAIYLFIEECKKVNERNSLLATENASIS